MDDKKIKTSEKTEEFDKKEEKKDQAKNSENEQFEKRIKELEDQLKRAVADYRNLERRSIEERSEAIKFANKNLIESLLPAFDTLFLASKYTQDENIRLTIARVIEILQQNGIEKIIVDNAKYNADSMEVIELVEGEDGMVIEEVRPGFILNGRLIRPAQVKVGSNKTN